MSGRRSLSLSLAAKRRCLAAFLVALALWPLVHRVLVVRLQINPWKFGGFAMYCTPPNKITVEVFGVLGGERRPLNLTRAPERVGAALLGFTAVRSQFGELARPHGVARALFAWDERIPDVEIEVRNLRLDPRTDRFAPTVRRYRYRRPAAPDGS